MTNEQTQARIAALEAERSEAMIAVGLTGYDHREDVTTPAQAIYALWADMTTLRTDIAASKEREAALAAALEEPPPNDPPYDWHSGRGTQYSRGREETWQYFEERFREVLAGPTAILATLRRKEAALAAALKAFMRMEHTVGGRNPHPVHTDRHRAFEMGRAALAALDAEEKVL